jgi:NADH-quinone oxidoreductase subunit H
MSPRRSYVRKRYWNKPEMGWWERAYIFEVVRGIRITGGVFIAHLWKWMTDAGFVLPGGRLIAMSHGWVVVIQLVTFLIKVLLLCSFQILVRWTLPRFRWDQVLRFAWKFMFPLALANLAVTAVAVWAFGAVSA